MPEKMILYYTDNTLEDSIGPGVREILKENSKGIPIVCVGKKHIDFGDLSIEIDLEERSRRAMFLQVQVGLNEAFTRLQPQYVYIAEHDCLYPPGYFDFIPTDPDAFYYTHNKYFMDDKEFVHGGITNLSTLICHYRLLLAHVNLRVYRIEKLNMKKGGWANCEPAVSGNDTLGEVKLRETTYPVVDIRHGKNLSKIYGERPFPERLREQAQQQIPYWGDHTKLRERIGWQV